MRVQPDVVAVVGLGAMGTGIVQSLATAGHAVVACGRSADHLDRARRAIDDGFRESTTVDAETARANVRYSDDLADAVATAALVVETVPEDLALKIALFRRLDLAAPPSAVLTSNTSGFPIGALAGATERPELVVGWHWAYPPVSKLFAEIVVTEATARAAIDTVVAAARRCGKHPIVVRDRQRAWGFVANRVWMAAVEEARRIVDEGVASPPEVDRLLVEGYGWPSGPFGTTGSPDQSDRRDDSCRA
jgi:3-hydroxyacyl-CoA dehydrogenase